MIRQSKTTKKLTWIC